MRLKFVLLLAVLSIPGCSADSTRPDSTTVESHSPAIGSNDVLEEAWV
jgi:hypothetical protein